ncbi:hypothetical protein Sjap_001686 [Stephania japonica]|uniref:Chalcone-flavonone isomerase family protein n=1 Tax=Stephania japonica TaxID=461633 RepID=A0AAP0KKE8_9MAGN
MGSSSEKVTALDVDNVVFGPTVKPPGSTNTLFLGGAGGAGVRGLRIQDKYIKFTAIGVYLEERAVKSLAVKYNGMTAEELTDSGKFFVDIVIGEFEKFTRITMILPLSGAQYSEKVAENCTVFLRSKDKYSESEAKALEQFLQVFKEHSFSPGASVLFTHSPSGALTIAFSEDGSVPDMGNAVIENKAVAEAVLESIIGENGVSLEAKRSLALRLCELMKGSQE